MSHVIDPEVATALAALQASGAYSTSLPRGDVLARREAIDALLIAIGAAEARTVGVVTADYEIPGHSGTPIHVRWYNPARSLSVLTRGAAVVYCHGGGYILGSTDTADTVVRAYVGATGVPFLSVDYRLSPEAQHPTSVEDCYAALQWLTEHSSELSVDPDRVAVMGDSAGGGLAAAVALLARERGGPAIAAQVLIYPMLDDRTDQVSPVLEPYLVWTVDDNVTGWDALLGDARGGPDVPPTAAPSRATDLTDLPPAYLEVGSLDLLRNEVLAYGARLSLAGVPVELHVHRGAPHAFEAIAPRSDLTRRALADRFRVLRSL